MNKITLFALAAILLSTTWRANAQTQPRPGGVTTSSYTWYAWLTPDSYNGSGTWVNNISGSSSIGNFVLKNVAPAKLNTGYNFHPSVEFKQKGVNRMESTNYYKIENNDNVMVFIVMKHLGTGGDYDYLLSFDTNTAATRQLVCASSTTLRLNWPSTANRNFTFTEGIFTLDNSNNNNTSDGIISYVDGIKGTPQSSGTATNNGSNKKMMIGSRENNSNYGFYGTIQELIVLKASGTSNHMNAVDLQKIHSYLAIKYGITLNNGSYTYINSDGQTVYANDATYNKYIFGIARDDASGLYQKQSQSISTPPFFTVFVGDNVANLNSANTSGRLDNKVYAMFGSNGADINAFTEITNTADQYTVPTSDLKLNYRKNLAYKVQVTGAAPSQKIKFKPSDAITTPEYMLISANPAFPASATKAIPFRGSIVEEEFLNGTYYISFGGRMTTATTGPGGINAGLKLWLRADDEASLTTELLTSGSGKLHKYPGATDGTTQPAVSAWKDLRRNQTYSFSTGASSSTKYLEPVYQQSNYMTNFHPAVYFWSYETGEGNTDTNGYASYLSNSNGVWSDKFPTDKKHSAFFVVNNDFSACDWFYTMMFSDRTDVYADAATGYRGPGYGVHKTGTGSAGVGRFRTNYRDDNIGSSGTRNLFTVGATTILGYHAENKGEGATDYVNILWRFNGLEDALNDSIKNKDFGLNQKSILGSGYRPNRTINGVMPEVIMYDGELLDANRQLIESYLALKYGVTLTPSAAFSSEVNKFDYKFSNGTMLWNGTAGTGTKWDKFYHRVAAAVRADNAELHNRQSHSTDVGSILHMGVAGTRLGSRVDVGHFPHDHEAIIWGDDNATGTTTIAVPDEYCGDFTAIFNRKWLVHKVTEGNRPIRMLVGAENNSSNQLGTGSNTGDLYDILTQNYDVYMIVADSAEKLSYENGTNPRYGKFKAVVPMSFLDGEQQCTYTFTDTIAYITFGYKPKPAAVCVSTVEFEGTKTYQWINWTGSSTSPSAGTGQTLTKGAVDLGDGVQVTSTSVKYAAGIQNPVGYPSVTHSPVTGGLYVQRRVGAINSVVTITIGFNTPVRPEFSLYDIDGYSGRFEKLTIKGQCNGGDVFPDLTYANSPATSFYKISGNTATAIVRRDLSPFDRNGQLDVAFRGGVEQIIIEYAITSTTPLPSTITNNLIISPIRIRQVPPAPPLNEDGLSFVKDVNERAITTCQPAEYSFYIENVNCDPKYVSFRDTLPPGMKWETAIGMDTINAFHNTHIRFNDYAGTDKPLIIDSLLVPGVSTLKLTATAVLDENAVPQGETKRFNNHAWIDYWQTVNGIPEEHDLRSVDRETLAGETWFDATWRDLQSVVTSDISTDIDRYTANSEVAVTLTIDNPNAAITDSYLTFNFDAGFTYKAGTFNYSYASTLAPVAPADSVLNLVNFTIPAGLSTFTFTLRAPTHNNLEPELDENDVPIGKVADLNIDYEFSSNMTDPCAILSIRELWGSKRVQFQWANDDYASTIPGIPVKIPVLVNDSIRTGCFPTPYITVSPKHGSHAIINDSILYTPSNNTYIGRDTLTYRLICSTDTSYANVYIYISEVPDNVIFADCTSDPPVQNWSIREATLNNNVLIHNYAPLTVGDIDGDGIVEILGFRDTVSANNEHDLHGYESRGLKMFYYNKSAGQIELKKEFPFITTLNGTGRTTSAAMGSMAIARYNNKGYIVIAGTGTNAVTGVTSPNKHLYAYNENGGLHWESDQPYLTNVNPNNITAPHVGTILGIADFSNDGKPEVYVGNQIFSLITGKKLCGIGTSNENNNHAGVLYPTLGYSPAVADIDGDGAPEIIAGRHIYKVNITNHDDQFGNTITHLTDMELTETLSGAGDGATQVADIDNDGQLEVVVISRTAANDITAYVWKPLPGGQSYIMGHYHLSVGQHYSIPMIGDIDGKSDGCLEIVFITDGGTPMHMHALKFNPSGTRGNQISLKWQLDHTDNSGDTGATLFDFNQDGISEIVYRDENKLRIFNGVADATPTARTTFTNVLSGTLREYPVIADIDDDGQAEIIVTGWDGHDHSVNSRPAGIQNGYLRVFKSYGTAWAPARKVWNQYGYNAVQVNNDLTIPSHPISPAKGFPGDDGIMGTNDDIRPYNAFLHQQTLLASDGTPLWLAPNARPLQSNSSVIPVNASSVLVTIAILNSGSAALGSPVRVALYKDSVSSVSFLMADSADIQINPGETRNIMITVPVSQSTYQIVARVNDNNKNSFPVQEECNDANNVILMLNTLLSQGMTKNAKIVNPEFINNGTYANPVSVFYGDSIEYTITVVNPIANHEIKIRDTLPAYLKYAPNTADPVLSPTNNNGNPLRDVLIWTIPAANSAGASSTVTYKALTAGGANASQPLYVNQAWVVVADTVLIPTNATYHQGAGTSNVLFSAGAGGSIYNADPQVVDYSTPAREGILVVPDEGYRFAGWSYGEYISHRGKLMEAQSGIMRYDTLAIYGDIELIANFEVEEYPIRYYLNGGENAANNPATYTIETGAIALEVPRKAGDVFIGWSGSNGSEPQQTVTIPEGSTGTREYYANFLYSGRDDRLRRITEPDKVWGAGHELYVRTSKTGSIVRIYTLEGILQEQHTILINGVTGIKLQPGIYVVTLNNNAGRTIIIE
jgi:uncharacterized repeat protein (TIGR02543 family)/uncharacterized repeat protein (TIGR01451 family)